MRVYSADAVREGGGAVTRVYCGLKASRITLQDCLSRNILL